MSVFLIFYIDKEKYICYVYSINDHEDGILFTRKMTTPPPTTPASSPTMLPDFQRFDINSDPTSIGIRWKTWQAEFENLLLALDVTDTTRQRVLLLYYAGKEVHDIYRSLLIPEVNGDFNAAKTRLTNYFEPKVNLTCDIFHFRKTRQGESDEKESIADTASIDAFVTRLRKNVADATLRI